MSTEEIRALAAKTAQDLGLTGTFHVSYAPDGSNVVSLAPVVEITLPPNPQPAPPRE